MKLSKFFPVAGAVMLFTLSTHAQSFLTNGLVAYYPFNGNANDASGNGNDGTVQGAALTTDRFGAPNSAYYFDGVSGGIKIPDTLLSPTVDGFTFSAWVGTDNGPYTGDYEIIHTGTDSGETVMNISAGQFAFGPLLDTHTGYIVTSPISSNSVNHLVGVYVRGQNVSLYTNGVLAAIIPVPDGTLWLDPTYALYSAIGIYEIYEPSPYLNFRGVIDDIRIYNRALSSNEVAQLHAYESTPQHSFPTNGLVAYYPFNGNANDASGNANNGTIYGGVTLVPDRFGNPNSAYSFNGVDGYIDIGNPLGNNPAALTESAWVNLASISSPPGVPNLDAIITKRQQPDSSWPSLGFVSSGPGTGAGAVAFDGPFYYNVSFGTTLTPTNEWVFICAVMTNSTYQIYINGSLEGTMDDSTTLNSSDDMHLMHEGAWGEFCNGVLDDVCIYNRALSQTEVAQLFAYESGPNTNPPSITIQPQPVFGNAGDDVSFNVAATGALPLNYQWSLNGTNISGANASGLTISNVAQTDLGVYAVVVSNSFGSTNSTDATLSMYPFIETPFVGAVTDWGIDTTLNVTGWGTGPLSYQWFKNGVALLNATNQTLFLPAIQFTNAGLYLVVLNSPLGSVTNVPAQVVVNPAGVSMGMFPGVYVSGVVGYTYTIQASSDLTNTNGWTTTATLTLLQPVQLWVDINVNALSPTNPHKYYRVVPGG